MLGSGTKKKGIAGEQMHVYMAQLIKKKKEKKEKSLIPVKAFQGCCG